MRAEHSTSDASALRGEGLMQGGFHKAPPQWEQPPPGFTRLDYFDVDARLPAGIVIARQMPYGGGSCDLETPLGTRIGIEADTYLDFDSSVRRVQVYASDEILGIERDTRSDAGWFTIVR